MINKSIKKFLINGIKWKIKSYSLQRIFSKIRIKYNNKLNKAMVIY